MCLVSSTPQYALQLKAAVPSRASITTTTADQVVLEAVQLINRLRRYIVDMARTWTADLVSVDEPKDLPVENLDETKHLFKCSSEPDGQKVVPELPTLMAPKLIDFSDGGHPFEDNLMQSDIIPAGLVARYVSYFEDQDTSLNEQTVERETSASYPRRSEAEATTIDLSQSKQDLQLHHFREETMGRECII